MSVNKGIQVSGGQVTAGAIAAGDRAIAIADRTRNQLAGGPLEEIGAKLAELTAELQRNAAQFEDADDLLESTTRIADELEKEKPSKTTVLGILGAIANGAKSVTSVVLAAGALEHAVTALL
jgi:methyl-accepting chemotaxis protein